MTTEEDEVAAIEKEARALVSASRRWRRLDEAALADIAKQHKALRARVEAHRDQSDADPDHDAFVDAEHELGFVKDDLARARKARRLVAEASKIDDAGFLDWLEQSALDGIPLRAMWERASTFFGTSKGRAERIFALHAWESLPDPAQIVPLLESAAEQGDADAAEALMHKQKERRDHWHARAVALRHPRLCLKEGRDHLATPRTPERLATAAQYFAWALEGASGKEADEAFAYLGCLHEMGWLAPGAPPVPKGFQPKNANVVASVRKLFGL